MNSLALAAAPVNADYEPSDADWREAAEAFDAMDYGNLCVKAQTEEYERWAWGRDLEPEEARGYWERELEHFRRQRPSCLTLPLSLAGVDARIAQAEKRLAALPDAEPTEADRAWWAVQSDHDAALADCRQANEVEGQRLLRDYAPEYRGTHGTPCLEID